MTRAWSSRDKDARKLVVVLEDDQDAAQVIRVGLEDSGLRVLTAGDGESGLALIRKEMPAAVILDVMMPKMNGYEVCAAMQCDKALCAIPIMVVTGVTDEHGAAADAAWCQRLCVADFISKPFEIAELTQRVLAMVGA